MYCKARDKCDYPDAAKIVAKSVANNDKSLGILICGTGNNIYI